MRNSRPPQAQRVLEYIEQFGSITQHQASLDLGVARLASRISELKKRGHNIKGEWITVKNRFDEDCNVKQYSMGGDENG